MDIKEKHFYDIAETKANEKISILPRERFTHIQNYFLIPVFHQEHHIIVDRCMHILERFTMEKSTMLILFVNGPIGIIEENLRKVLEKHSKNNPYIIWFHHIWTKKEKSILTMSAVRKILCDFVVSIHRQLNISTHNKLLIQADCDIMSIADDYIKDIREEFNYRELKHNETTVYRTIHDYSATSFPDLDMYITLENPAANILDYYYYRAKRKNYYLIKKPEYEWTRYFPADTCVAYSLTSYIQAGGYPIPKNKIQETGQLIERMSPVVIVQIPTFIMTSPRRQYWSIFANKSLHCVTPWNSWGEYGETGRIFTHDAITRSAKDGVYLRYLHQLEIEKSRKEAWLFSFGCATLLRRYPYFILRFLPKFLKKDLIKIKIPPAFR